MFVAAVALFMGVFPVVSTLIEALTRQHHEAVIDLIGKWFVFWAVGVRLLTAGVRQIVRPDLTSEGILGIKGRAVWQLVRELGFANTSIGLVGVLSLWKSEWRLADAIAGGLFLLLAGLEHVPKKNRNADENLAMYFDLAVALVLAVYVAWRI